MRIPVRQYISLFASYLRPQWRRVVPMAFFLLVGIALQLVNPQILRYFIDTARGTGSLESLSLAGALFIGIVLLQQLSSVLDTYFSETVAWAATNALRSDLARHILALDMRYHNLHPPGELIERIDGDVTLLANFFSRFVLVVLANGLLMAGIVIMLFAVDWRIGLATAVYAVLVLALLNRLRGISIPAWIEGREASAEMAGFLEERLAATEDIRSSRATEFVMGQFHRIMRRIYLAYRKAYVLATIAGTTARFFFTAGLALGLGLGAYFYLQHEISLGTMYMISYYSAVLGWPLFEITDQLDDLQQASAGLARVNLLRAMEPEIREGNSALPPGPVSVEFAHVTFGYNPHEPVLHDISFRLEPGEVLGILGRTGSGKSTISRLLFRLYDPQRGSVSLSGVDLRRLQLSALRGHVGLVTQEVQLFHASVRDNLTFFDHTIGDARLQQVIDILGLTTWLESLPDGLNTPHTGGAGLSAGEAQLLAVARVFLKDPDVVVLDEASSRLDPATERLIERAVNTLLRGRSAIIIAHRLHTVHRADTIMLLSDGRIVEYGPRAGLAADESSGFARLLRTGLELEPA